VTATAQAVAGPATGRRVAYRTCSLCEATCGLELTLVDGRVERIRGDAQDVFSHGFVCPKGASLGQLQEDPDRLRAPLVRGPDGTLQEATWPEAYARVAELLEPILAEHGPDAVATFIGNPMGQSLSGNLYLRAYHKALGTRQLYTVGTVDQHPRSLANALLYGTQFSVPVPDLDRTDHLLVLGANPVVSQGSLVSAPDIRRRLRKIRARGGRIVVIDPRRTRTAKEADEHHFVRPGTDALLLAGLAATLFEEGLVTLGRLEEHVSGLDDVRRLCLRFPPERVASRCGIEATVMRRLARELAAAERAVVYGRCGTTTQAFGTATSWLVDVLNVLTANLDRPGGAMFATPATGGPTFSGEPGTGSRVEVGRWRSRVSGRPEVLGELSVGVLAEEIATDGPGRVRALVTFSGNPVLSCPNGTRLGEALEQLDCFVALDPYVNETTRHAHVILPPPSPLERAHYPVAVYPTALRNVANYSPPALPRPNGMPDEWETIVRLTGIVSGLGAEADVDELDRALALDTLRRRTKDPWSPVAGRNPEELLGMLEPRTGQERMLDVMLRCGPHGDHFGARPEGLTLARLEAQPHGIDLGPLEPRLPGALRTPSGTVELGHPLLLAEGERLERELAEPVPPLVLIGRREHRSLNSWLHNLPALAGGRRRCTLLVHPDDAGRLGLADRGRAAVRSRIGEIELEVEVSDEMMPGVVSVPHGFGHGRPGTRLAVAAAEPGASANDVTDEQFVDPVSGTVALNGVPVEITACG
jgi:anaerobic selenocysteine-containing dehydrogenase